MLRKILAALSAVLLSAAADPAEAKVVRLEVVATESPAFEGREFGPVGRYEKIVARAHLAVDPADPHNAGIVDLRLAPRNARGLVEFTADLTILKPVDLARGNGRLFYDVLNRGNKIGLILMNDAPGQNDPKAAADAGNGFLMRQGYTVVWSGWQGDVPAGAGRMLFRIPTVPGVTGVSREEFIFDHSRNPVTVDLTYPAADQDPAKAALTVRGREGDVRQKPEGLKFKFLAADKVEIERPQGFDAGAIYEFIYTAKDPKPMGLGFAATRDIVSFLRYEAEGNPLTVGGRPGVQHALALGISQSGRFLRDLLYQGFNVDEADRRVFDGLIPHIAGSRKTFVNYRFAQPGRYSRQHEDHLYPGDQFPFAYTVATDPISGRTDGVLSRCLAAGNCPKIVHTDTSTEVFQGRVGMNTTAPAGHPFELPNNVRAYLLAGVPHFNQIAAKPGEAPACKQLTNPLHAGAPMRALLVALDRWVSDGTPPPTGRYPSLANGGLVPADPAQTKFPAIPGVAYAGVVNALHLVSQTQAPPQTGKAYPNLIAKVDGDGHEITAIRLPAVEAPIATYLGWNTRKAGFSEGALCSLTGSYIPFAKTKAEREAKNDPRPSLEERYPSHSAYVTAVTKAAKRLEARGLMLDEDVRRSIDAAKASDIGKKS
jgi:hypothetical protein